MKSLVQRNLNRRGFWFGFLATVTLWFCSITPSSAQTLAEGLDTTNLVWTTGGDAVWFAQTMNTHDGIDAVRSGVLGSNQTTWIETTIIGPGTVHLWSLRTTNSYSPTLSFVLNPDPSNPAPQSPGLPTRPSLGNVWSEGLLDLANGTNVLRWIARNYYDTASQGFVALDEFSLSPPRPLTFYYEPEDYTVYAGEVGGYGGYGGYFGPGAILFIASAIGTPPFQFQWRKDGTNLPGANAEWLRFTNVTQADAGNYSLVVSNSQGFIVSSNALLTVLPPTPPFWVYEPASVEVYSGQTVYVQGGINGSQPFTFQWRRDGTNLPGATSPLLLLTNLSLADAGSYRLLVTNKHGSIESSNAVVTVIPSIAPVITKHPRSLEVAAGVHTWMSVLAVGDPAPAYQWARIGDPPPPPPSDPFPFPQQGPSSPSKRSFTNVISTDAGIYSATAANLAGQIKSREALLTVLPPLSSIGSWPQGAEDIYVTNGLAFLAQGSSGFAILSVTNPATPVLLGAYNTLGSASAVAVVGNRAYVADGSAGLQILSITNPSSPALLGNYNTPDQATDVFVRSNLAYVADRKSGLLIINVSNPASPSLVGSYKTNFNAEHIRVAGDYAFVSSPYSEILPGTNKAGFFVINVSDPSHPIEIARLSSGFGNFEVQGQAVYAVNGDGLNVIAVTDPAQPTVIGSFKSYGYPVPPGSPFPPPLLISAWDVCVVNDIAYLGGDYNNEGRLYAIDVRDPTEPIPVGYYTNVGNRYVLWAERHVVYFGGDESSVDIIQTPFNPNPKLPPTLTLSKPLMHLGIHGRRGINYSLETATSPTGQPWQGFQTILLTNDVVSFPIAPSGAAQFFRLRQLD